VSSIHNVKYVVSTLQSILNIQTSSKLKSKLLQIAHNLNKSVTTQQINHNHIKSPINSPKPLPQPPHPTTLFLSLSHFSQQPARKCLIRTTFALSQGQKRLEGMGRKRFKMKIMDDDNILTPTEISSPCFLPQEKANEA
jgi:hypothetical protein